MCHVESLETNPPPIHHDRLPGDERGIVRGEEGDGADEILRCPHPLDRLLRGGGIEHGAVLVLAVVAVRVSPGAMAFTVTPASPTSVARARVKPIRPALLVI